MARERVEEKPSLSGHAQAASRRVWELRPGAAADHCLFPHSLPVGGGGGGEVTSAPRLAPRPRRGPGSPAGSAFRTVAAASLEAVACSPAAAIPTVAAVPTVKRRPSAPCTVSRAPPGAGAPRAQHLSGPGAPLRAPLRLAPFPALSGSVSHASNCRICHLRGCFRRSQLFILPFSAMLRSERPTVLHAQDTVTLILMLLEKEQGRYGTQPHGLVSPCVPQVPSSF
nr:translation initiation factor IF-2-like isoform X2 [Equus asinus]